MLKIDLHLHTIASGHAQNTILEYINQAKKLKMKMIGFAEHGLQTEGVFIKEIYFKVLDRIPKIINGIRVLQGIEANILNSNGEIDVTDRIISEKLDYVIAGFHKESPYQDGGIYNNTEAMVKCIKSGRVNIISHPFVTDNFNFDIEKVSQAACRSGVLLEVNLHYLTEKELKPVTLSNLKIMINVVEKNKKKVIVNSDAHNIWEMADDSPLLKIKKKIGLTDEMIINNYPKELMRFLKVKN